MRDGRTAGELLDERLKTRSSGLYALARFLKVSLEDRNPSKPCASVQGGPFKHFSTAGVYLPAWHHDLHGSMCAKYTRKSLMRRRRVSY